jgi:hypothetical protein
MKYMNYHVVISYYNENNESIVWLDEIKDKVFFYNKGEIKKNNIFKNYECLPNVGRESHTYLYYIINNYDKLPDYVVFSQANPDENFDNALLSQEIINFEKKMSGENYYFPWKLSFNDVLFGLDDNFRIKHFDKWKNIDMQIVEMNFMEWLDILEIKDIETKLNNYIFSPHGIFFVSKKLILSRSLEFYKKLIKYIDNHNNPEYGHYFERSWYFIFNCHIV